MINGNLVGVKKSVIARLEKLEGEKVDKAYFITNELMEELSDITEITGREVSIYISRAGDIVSIAIGEADRVTLESLTLRRSEDRLSGIRCIHTHPGGNGMLSVVDIESLKKLRFDAMCALGVKGGKPADCSMAVLTVNDDGDLDARTFYSKSAYDINHEQWLEAIVQADKDVLKRAVHEVAERPERVLLIGHEAESLKELARLVDTAGGIVTEVSKQARTNGEPVGYGKLKELALVVQAKNIDLAVYDDELTAAKQRNLEEALGTRVIDRTALILDIFALRANTREGQLQVELAQANYALTRLIGEGTALSRLGGGIGTRGPGEKKLETDRRVLRKRIHDLRTELHGLSQQRNLQRKRREKQGIPQIALVGYTNAGKSSLLNVLTGAQAFAEDKLFATLDPLTRSVELDKNLKVCFTDTVGFIKKLPHQLVEAFKSTLEEAAFADILIHVCDGSNPEVYSQIEAVNDVLQSIGATDIPTILVVNKIDAVSKDALPNIKDAVYISAKTGEGLEDLKAALLAELAKAKRTSTIIIPYSRGDLLAYIHQVAEVSNVEYKQEGTEITFTARAEEMKRIEHMIKAVSE